MKSKRSSFALSEDIAAKIPMADEPFNPFAFHGPSSSSYINKPQNSQEASIVFSLSNTTETSYSNLNSYEQQNFVVYSPPMAFADELTDSEISDLERQVASGEIFIDRRLKNLDDTTMIKRQKEIIFNNKENKENIKQQDKIFGKFIKNLLKF